MPASNAIFLFLVTSHAKKYIVIPDKKVTKNIKHFMHPIKDAPINLKINGKNAVKGL